MDFGCAFIAKLKVKGVRADTFSVVRHPLHECNRNVGNNCEWEMMQVQVPPSSLVYCMWINHMLETDI